MALASRRQGRQGHHRGGPASSSGRSLGAALVFFGVFLYLRFLYDRRGGRRGGTIGGDFPQGLTAAAASSAPALPQARPPAHTRIRIPDRVRQQQQPPPHPQAQREPPTLQVLQQPPPPPPQQLPAPPQQPPPYEAGPALRGLAPVEVAAETTAPADAVPQPLPAPSEPPPAPAEPPPPQPPDEVRVEAEVDDTDPEATLHVADPFFGSAPDLAHHRGNAECWAHFDFGLLEAWDLASTTFCAPPGSQEGGRAPPAAAALALPAPSSDGTDSGGAWLRCRVMSDAHLPVATAPHTLCDGARLELDVSRLTPTTCLASRPGYKCDGDAVHWAFGAGALRGAAAGCERTPDFQPHAFPRDHLMDMFASFSFAAPGTAAAAGAAAADPGTERPADGEIVLVMAREKGEHANPFHATTDFLNAFFALHVTGVIDGVAGARSGMERVQVLLLDEQRGPFDADFVGRVLSPEHPVLRVSAIKAEAALHGGRLKMLRAIFVPPGYSNMLLAHVSSEGDCHAGTQLFQSFRRFVLSAFPELESLAAAGGEEGAGSGAARAAADAPVAVTFVSRRPYVNFIDHHFVGRQVDNEEELLAAMSAEPGVTVTRLDFATLGLEAQLGAVARSEVLVGMHGAALTHALYLPHHGAVLELWPKERDMWRCFEHLAAMCGLHYARWENRNHAAFRADAQGDYTRVDVAQVGALFHEAVTVVRARRGARPELAAAAAAQAASAR